MTDGETTETTRTIRPFWGRVVVIESPVDEEQRDSGLVVPLHYQGQKDDFKRGVVQHVDQGYHETGGQWAEYTKLIGTGTVVFFRNGVKVTAYAWVVDIDDVLAYEADE